MHDDVPQTEPDPTRQLTIVRTCGAVAAISASVVVPAIVADAGEHATRRFLEFFAATIRNKNTRTAYLHAAGRFFTWCEHHQIGQLADIEPLHVAAHIEALGKDFEKPTVKQHLAAIRMLFDWLVIGQVVATNPAHAVRGPKHVVKTGKTTVLDAEQARKLLDSIDTSTVVGLRDRALISIMTFAFARIGAVVAIRVEDYPKGKRWWVRLHEKGGEARRPDAKPGRRCCCNLYAVKMSMKKIWLVPALLLTGCTGLGVTAPDYAIGTYRGVVIGRGSCAFPAAELTVNVAKWSAYGDWYFEQQNIREPFVDGGVDSGGFLWGRRTPPYGMVYVGGFFASDGSALDVRIDTESCNYTGFIART